MHARVFDERKLPSRYVTEDSARVPHRSCLCAIGVRRKQIHRPPARFVAESIGLGQPCSAGASPDESRHRLELRGIAEIFKPTPYGASLEAHERQAKDFGSGASWKYVQGIGPAKNRAAACPGKQGETHVYADL